jgi:hypothetical protein
MIAKKMYLIVFLLMNVNLLSLGQVRFILVNADTDTDVRDLHNFDTIYYSNTSHITIRAEYVPNPGAVNNVKFLIQNLPFSSETVPPYSLSGDRNGDFLPYTPNSSPLTQSVKARAFNGTILLGETTLSIHFVDTTGIPPSIPSISDLVLVDADTDQDISELNNGDVIRLNLLPELNIRAVGNIPSGGSVTFRLQNLPVHRIENKAPYALYGDNNGDFTPGDLGPRDSPSVGNYELSITATPYSGPNASGVSGIPVTVNVIVAFGPRPLRVASAFPNPATGSVNISIEDQAEVEVYDLTGKIYYRGITDNTQENTINLDQLKVPNGIYFIKFIFSDKSQKVLPLLKN